MSRSFERCCVAGLSIAIIALLLPDPALQAQGNPNPGVAPIHSRVAGRSYGEWNARWWQWAVQFPDNPQANPVMDPDGSAAALGQSGPVWFLAGNYGGTSVRNVTIPPGKRLLVPVFNQEWDNVYGFDPLGYAAGSMSVPQLLEVCDYIADRATNLSCTLDGVAVQNLESYRCPSPVFTMSLEPTLAAFWGYPTGPITPCVADGIYVIFNPLPKGQHTLHLHAENLLYPWFIMDVTYHITIG